MKTGWVTKVQRIGSTQKLVLDIHEGKGRRQLTEVDRGGKYRGWVGQMMTFMLSVEANSV